MKKDYSGLIWGIVILAIGTVLGGNALNIWYIDIFFPGWWTLFLIVPGLVGILRYGFDWGYGILTIIGIVLLLNCLDIVDKHLIWSLIFPLVLIAVGISIIASFFRRGKRKDNDGNYNKSRAYKYDANSYPRYTAILGGGEYKNNSQDLKGISAEAILGGIDLDLRDAKITEDILLELTAVLGGIDIILPDNVQVEIVSGIPVLGGFEHKVNRNNFGPKVKIKYTVVMGGIEIK